MRLIWAFKPPFQLEARLRVVETWRATIEREFPLSLRVQIAETFAFNRGR